MVIREDFLLRLIRQIAIVLARAAGLRRDGKLDQALAEIEAAQQTYFGPLAELLPRLDADTAVHMLGSTDRILAWAALLRVEAEILEQQGSEAHAARLREQAVALLTAARARAPDDAGRIEAALRDSLA